VITFLLLCFWVGFANSFQVGNEPALGLLDCQPEENARRSPGEPCQHRVQLREELVTRVTVHIDQDHHACLITKMRKALQLRRKLMQQGLLFRIRLAQ